MKPFLGIDVTENKKNEQSNGEEFLLAKISPEMSQELAASMESAMDAARERVRDAVKISCRPDRLLWWGGVWRLAS